jgi:hypothetical protein
MAMLVGVISEGCVPIAKTSADSDKKKIYLGKILILNKINKKSRPALSRTGHYFFKMKSRFTKRKTVG